MGIPAIYSVQAIKKSEVYPWILKRHYAHRIPSISYAMGLFQNKELLGICTFGKPASPDLCRGICGEEHSTRVYELNRLCIEEGSGKNVASFFVASCLKLLPQETIIVSYADTGMQHIGYVYQACNFIYTGITKKHIDYVLSGINNKHSRHESVTKGTLNSIGIERTRKHRYVYLVGNKTWKKRMKENINYPIKSYPKGDNKRYDSSVKVEKQGHLF